MKIKQLQAPEMSEGPASRAGSEPAGRYRVDDLVIDTGIHQVQRNGQAIPLPPLSYQLLLALVDAAPNMLSHDELIEKVWPGRVISPETLTQRIRLLRQALNDDAREPRYVGLVRGEGYRLLVPVHIEQSAIEPLHPDHGSAPERPGRQFRRGLLVLVATALAISGFLYLYAPTGPEPQIDSAMREQSVAVLWFDNATGEEDKNYLSDGIARELGDLLRELPGLQVAGLESSLALRNQQADVSTIAEQLGVRFLIRGTLNKAEDDINIRVAVIDGSAATTIWEQEFTRPRDMLLELQQDIARQVIGVLLPTRSTSQQPPRQNTVDASAQDLLLLARYLEARVKDQLVVDEVLLRQVIGLYHRAIEADPTSAVAYSRLANALLYLGDMDAAESAMQQALELAPDSSEVQYTLGLYHWRRGEPEGGEAFARAVELNPNNPDALSELAKWEWHQARADLTEDLLLKALSLDRMALTRYAQLGNFYGLCRQREKAIAVAQQVLERFPTAEGMQVAARIFEVAGELDKAIAWVTRARQLQPQEADISWQLAELYARIGEFEAANRAETEPGVAQLFFARRYQDLLDVGTEQLIDDPGDIKLYYLLGFAYNALGYHANAVRLLNLTGLPQSVYSAARRADAVEALVTLADAHYQMGDMELATEYAAWILTMMNKHIETGVQIDWWPFLYSGCALELLGEREQALERLAELSNSIGLVWYPALRDLNCFRRMADEPRYQSAVNQVEQTMAALRSRLPETLDRYGVESEGAR
jgi:DNA-binding winged helix-turn-helix (wHTH) protein/TolB-like protein/Tfp pilus assembly protein PilF